MKTVAAVQKITFVCAALVACPWMADYAAAMTLPAAAATFGSASIDQIEEINALLADYPVRDIE